MTNPHTGEISFQALGQTWTFVLDFNGLCAIEQDLKTDVMNRGLNLNSPLVLRATLAQGLKRAHALVSVDDLGGIVDEIGMAELAIIIGTSTQATYAKPPARRDDSGDPR
jgi:hypothetical protein